MIRRGRGQLPSNCLKFEHGTLKAEDSAGNYKAIEEVRGSRPAKLRDERAALKGLK